MGGTRLLEPLPRLGSLRLHQLHAAELQRRDAELQRRDDRDAERDAELQRIRQVSNAAIDALNNVLAEENRAARRAASDAMDAWPEPED